MTVVNEAFVSPRVQHLQPYQPGEQPKVGGLVKLNTNENPYPPSPHVVQRIKDSAATSLKLYPDPESDQLCETIAQYYGVARDQVFVGNGSDEVLAHAFCAFFQHDETKLLIPSVTYNFYSVYCRLFGIAPELVPVDDALRVDLAAFAAAAHGDIAGIVISNPNAPTGESLPLASVEYLLSLNPNRVVLVDEAYVDFGGQSAVALIQKYPNLLIVQTLSKSRSLAGLRVGFALAQPALISVLNRVKNSFNSFPLGCLAQQGAIAAFEDTDYFEQTRQAVMATRTTLASGLTSLGFEVLPSSANFLFVRHPQYSAALIAAKLREGRILVRHFSQERVAQYLRISIGTDQQVQYLLKVLEHLLSKVDA